MASVSCPNVCSVLFHIIRINLAYLHLIKINVPNTKVVLEPDFVNSDAHQHILARTFMGR